MRKVSNILLLVGGICAIVCAVSLLVTAIVFFVGGSSVLSNFLTPILEKEGVNDPEKVTLIIQLCSIFMGIFFLLMAIFAVPSAIVSFAAQKKPTKGLLIANIILGYLSGSSYNMAGGIVGLIANAREERKAKNSNVVDAQ